jgi:hypothetical protein
MSYLDNASPADWDKASAFAKQVGGTHYKDMEVQPLDYILANNLGFCEGNIVKYITRYAMKGGPEDLDKVIHYAELLKEAKYGRG